ncbi:HinT-interacting membrane complex lipoprotein P60 [Mycoplasma buteonis]|uniref:HinT-interacting membrane complex lipoprotein P60 n=1 Tax=Mycoplasma buteonis TaxID=171280 RepID=UPI00056C5D58|nr:hypothetical protein [Mycoplasma buteonis]
MKKWFKSFLALSSTVSLSAFALSCGRTEDSVSKIEQDKLLSEKDSVSKLAENIWLANTLASQYNVQLEGNLNLDGQLEKLITNEAFFNDAYDSYLAYLSNKNLTEPGFLAKRINDLLANGKIVDGDIFNSFVQSPAQNNLTKEQFTSLFNNSFSEVANETNKILLTYKYFLINASDDLLKLNGDLYNQNKNKFDNKYFNLVNYALNKELMQAWNYSSNDSNAIFTEIFKSIDSVDAFNDFIKNKSVGTDKLASNLWINKSAPYQLQMGGYDGVIKASSKGVNFNFTYDTLSKINDYQSLVGFYDYQNQKIIPVLNQNDKWVLQSPISVAQSQTNIGVTYLNIFAPIAKEESVVTGKNEDGSDRRETVSLLTFDGTPYQDNLIKTVALLYASDATLYQNAQNAFVKLGYTFTLKNISVINEILKGLKFVKSE